jgi:5S rRNA maturation endonuclease (ribonuclease M5)
MDDAERFEALLGVLGELREANLTTPIVVEGQRDVASLRLLGLKGEIIPLHSGEPLFQVAEEIATQAKSVILLTDWDRKGELLFDHLAMALGANGVRVERQWRDDLRHRIRPTIPDIESLASYVGRKLAEHHRRDLGDLLE